MATIDITRSHGLGLETAKEKATVLADGMKDKLGIVWRWDGDRIRFDAPSGIAKGATGVITVAASTVRVEIDLPLLLRAMKSTVASKVEQKLNEALGPTP
jgi:putative polyhydroxyalkanoate system protein